MSSIDDKLPEWVTNIVYHKSGGVTIDEVTGPNGEYTGNTIIINKKIANKYIITQHIYYGSVKKDIGIALYKKL